MYVCMYVLMHVCMYVCKYVCMCVCMCVCVCVFVCWYVCMYVVDMSITSSHMHVIKASLPPRPQAHICLLYNKVYVVV